MKLGILLVNQKMKLKLEVRYLEKTLDESNKSLFDKIKSMFKNMIGLKKRGINLFFTDIDKLKTLMLEELE